MFSQRLETPIRSRLLHIDCIILNSTSADTAGETIIATTVYTWLSFRTRQGLPRASTIYYSTQKRDILPSINLYNPSPPGPDSTRAHTPTTTYPEMRVSTRHPSTHSHAPIHISHHILPSPKLPTPRPPFPRDPSPQLIVHTGERHGVVRVGVRHLCTHGAVRDVYLAHGQSTTWSEIRGVRTIRGRW